MQESDNFIEVHPNSAISPAKGDFLSIGAKIKRSRSALNKKENPLSGLTIPNLLKTCERDIVP